MNSAPMFYEDLRDWFLYTARSWLHLDLASATMDEANEICGAAAFLFGHLFLAEDVGPSITRLVKADLGPHYSSERLSGLATKMRLAMTGDDFSLGTSPLREYIKWVKPSAPTVEYAFTDNAGKLVLVTAEEFVNLFLRENDAQHAPLHVSEIVFLTLTDLFANYYIRSQGNDNFRAFRSYPYFESISEEMKRIRSESIE